MVLFAGKVPPIPLYSSAEDYWGEVAISLILLAMTLGVAGVVVAWIREDSANLRMNLLGWSVPLLALLGAAGALLVKLYFMASLWF